MTSTSGSRQCVTAEQAVEMFHARLEAEPDLREKLQRADGERRAQAGASQAAEAPILAELRELGIDVTTVWDLHKVTGAKATASPVLLRHLRSGGYPRLALEGMASALDVDWVRTHWDEVKDLYVSGSVPETASPLASVLQRAGRRAQLDDMISMLTNPALPESRLMFVQKVLRVGGERGLAVVESLRDDPVVGKEATARLRRRR